MAEVIRQVVDNGVAPRLNFNSKRCLRVKRSRGDQTTLVDQRWRLVDLRQRRGRKSIRQFTSAISARMGFRDQCWRYRKRISADMHGTHGMDASGCRCRR